MPMPDRLYFTESDDANALIAADPMALLIGFALDQQVTVQKAFSGPLVLRERIGTLDPAALADVDLGQAGLALIAVFGLVWLWFWRTSRRN